MGETTHSVEASSPMVLCSFQRSDLWNLFRSHPARA
jgi:CRP/FNR family transcriptional regulator, anaerobic regulatory protein